MSGAALFHETQPLQEDTESALGAHHEPSAGVTRPWHKIALCIAVLATAAGALALHVGMPGGRAEKVGEGLVGKLVLLQEFNMHPDSSFRPWNQDESLDENMHRAFDHFIKASKLEEELTGREREAFKQRFLEECQRQAKAKKIDQVVGHENRLANTMAVELWAGLLKQAIKDEMPEVTDSFVRALNAKNLGFTAHETERMLNVSAREVQLKCGTRKPEGLQLVAPVLSSRRLESLPSEFDARRQWPQCEGVIGRPHNQGVCGSCWAMAAIKAMEDRLCIATGGAFSGPDAFLSRTVCTSCSGIENGCEGGWPDACFNTIAKVGVPTSKCVPYFSHGHGASHFDIPDTSPPCPTECVPSSPPYPRAFHEDLFSFGSIGEPQTFATSDSAIAAMKLSITHHGPVVGAVFVDRAWYAYASGVYNSGCAKDVNHAINVIGWGTLAGNDYWTVRNSWGDSDQSDEELKVAYCVVKYFIEPGRLAEPPKSIPRPMFPGGSEETPAPPTRAPPSPTPNPTPSPAPSSPFKVETGGCEVDESGCITSPGYRQQKLYGNNEHCEISVSQDTTLEVEEMLLEDDYDYITVDGGSEKYSNNGHSLHLQKAVKAVDFFSDSSVTSTGFRICAASKVHPDPKQVVHISSCSETGDDIAEPLGTVLHVECAQKCENVGGWWFSSSLWGTGRYTQFSPVCLAGWHATGSLSFSMTFINGFGAGVFRGSTQNGIQSLSFPIIWPWAFQVQA